MQLGNIKLPTGKVDCFCQKWQVTELALFGNNSLKFRISREVIYNAADS